MVTSNLNACLQEPGFKHKHKKWTFLSLLPQVIPWFSWIFFFGNLWQLCLGPPYGHDEPCALCMQVSQAANNVYGLKHCSCFLAQAFLVVLPKRYSVLQKHSTMWIQVYKTKGYQKICFKFVSSLKNIIKMLMQTHLPFLFIYGNAVSALFLIQIPKTS